MIRSLPNYHNCPLALKPFTRYTLLLLFFCDRVDNRCQRLALACGSSSGGSLFHVSLIVNKNPSIYRNQHFISASLDSGAQQAVAATEDGEEDEWRFDFLINAA